MVHNSEKANLESKNGSVTASGSSKRGVVISSVILFGFVLFLYISFFFIMASRSA